MRIVVRGGTGQVGRQVFENPTEDTVRLPSKPVQPVAAPLQALMMWDSWAREDDRSKVSRVR